LVLKQSIYLLVDPDEVGEWYVKAAYSDDGVADMAAAEGNREGIELRVIEVPLDPTELDA
jgi:hypothetical protein